MMLRERKTLDIVLLVLLVVSVLLILFTNEDPRFRDSFCASLVCLTSEYSEAWNKVIYDLSIGSVISLVFYALIVRLPEYEKRQRIKRSFKAQYASFKEDCIEIFLLLADGSYSADFPEQLLEQVSFRNYFKEAIAPGQDRWGRLIDNLEGYYLEQLLKRMESFREEILFVLNNVDIDSDKTLEFMKQFSRAIRSVNVTTLGYDNKQLMQLLWSMFTGWSFVDGYASTDIIEEAIQNI